MVSAISRSESYYIIKWFVCLLSLFL
jgi:hypothetical protein